MFPHNRLDFYHQGILLSFFYHSFTRLEILLPKFSKVNGMFSHLTYDFQPQAATALELKSQKSPIPCSTSFTPSVKTKAMDSRLKKTPQGAIPHAYQQSGVHPFCDITSN